MEKFLRGITRFQNEVFPASRHLYEQLAEGQQPETLYIGCSDSRVIPNELMQALPGELFICRNAGNLVPAYGESLSGVTATIEYAVEVLKVRHIVVCGHSDCGAMKALMAPEKVTHLKAVAQWIKHADRAAAVARELHGQLDDQNFLSRLIEENVVAQLDHLLTYPCVATRLRTGNLFLHGLVFDIKSGAFSVLDRSTHQFTSLDEAMARRAAQQTQPV
ncbi:MAG: carbonic anhydrase [Acidobacteria bacterium]|nr:carbonic anhydrase [Acidobacteriota bacterium]